MAALLTTISVTLLLGITLTSSVEHNPVKVFHNYKREVFSLVPQGWAFFTRSPREAQISVYQIATDGSLTPLNHHHHQNYLGLNRDATRLISELGVVKSNLADSLWVNTTWNYQSELYGSLPETTVTVTNPVKNAQLCGELLVVLQPPVPWAWSKSIDQIKMPAKAIRLNILCSNF